MIKKSILISVISTIVFIGIRYGIIHNPNIQINTSFNLFEFGLTCISAISIILGFNFYEENDEGYDKFAIFNFIGVILGYVIGYRIGNYNLGNLFLIASILLFFGISQFKNIPFFKASMLASTIGLSIIFYGVIELLEVVKTDETGYAKLLFKLTIDAAIFYFLLSTAYLSLKIKNITFELKKNIGLGILTLLSLLSIYYSYVNFYKSNTTFIASIILIIAPLLIATFKTFSSTTEKEIKNISQLVLAIYVGSSLCLLTNHI